MSLTEIEKAVANLSAQDLARLAAFVARRDKLAWDQELEADFSPGGRHASVLEQLDAEIDAGKFRPLA